MVRKISIVLSMPAKVSGGERKFQSFRGGWNKWEAQPLERRDAYMAALEQASVGGNIVPFAEFLAQLIDEGLKGKVVAKIPSS